MTAQKAHFIIIVNRFHDSLRVNMKIKTTVYIGLFVLCPLFAFAETSTLTANVSSEMSSGDDGNSASVAHAAPLERNRTRYLLAPSNFMLKEGESYLSQTMLMLSTFSYGVTDQLTLSLSAATPLWVMDIRDGFNILPRVRYGWELDERWRAAAGVEVLVLQDVGTITLPYVGTTWGTQRHHVTLNIGQPFHFDTSSFAAARFILTSINAHVWLSTHFRLITENVFLYFDSDNVGFEPLKNSLAVRIQGQQFATDLGMSVIGILPLPWLDFTYNF